MKVHILVLEAWAGSGASSSPPTSFKYKNMDLHTTAKKVGRKGKASEAPSPSFQPYWP